MIAAIEEARSGQLMLMSIRDLLVHTRSVKVSKKFVDILSSDELAGQEKMLKLGKGTYA